MAHYAFLAVPDEETPEPLKAASPTVCCGSTARGRAAGAAIFRAAADITEGQAAVLAARIHAIDPRLAVQVYERDAQRETLERVDPCADGNINAWLVPHRESQCFWSVLQRQSRRSGA